MDVVIYTRVSTDEQKENGYSLPDQERKLRQHCRETNKRILNHYQDDYSAKDFNRPGFNQFLRDLKQKKIRPKQLVCVKQDRFSRSLNETVVMTQALKKLGIEIYFLENNVDSSKPESVLLYAINAALPEVDNLQRALNTWNGMRQAMRQGRWPWKAPKGYLNDKVSKVVIKSEDSKFVVRAFEQVALNLRSIDSVRIELNSMGFKVSKQQFINLLKNPFYKGIIFIKSWKNEKEEYVKGIHEPLIDENLFTRVQLVLNSRNRRQTKPATYASLFPLRGHLNCKICGNALTASSSMGRSRKYPYYHCQKGCKERFNAESANSLFIEYLSSFVVNSEVSELYLEILRDEFNKNEDLTKIQLKDLKRQIDALDEQTRTADLKFMSGVLPDEHYLRIVKGIKEKEQNLKAQLQLLEESPTRFDKQLQFGINLISQLPYYYSNASVEIKHKIIGSIFTGNLIFDKNSYRTEKPNLLIELICSDSINYRAGIKEKTSFSRGQSSWAPPDVLFSNQLKEDLNRIVDLQSFIDVSIEAQPQNNHQIFKGFVANIDLNR
jgi:site-specific DNA recombinase